MPVRYLLPRAPTEGHLALVILAGLIVIGCKRPAGTPENLPKVFGIYASGTGEFVPIQPVRPASKGNLLTAAAGIKELPKVFLTPEGAAKFAVYLSDRNVANLRLSRLTFQHGTDLDTPFGTQYYETGFWVGAGDVPILSGGLDQGKGIFFATPTSRLLPGRYAFHYGELATTSMIEATMGGTVFPFHVVQKGRRLLIGEVCVPSGESLASVELSLQHSGSNVYEQVRELTPLEGVHATFAFWRVLPFETLVTDASYVSARSLIDGKGGCLASEWTSCARRCPALDDDCFRLCSSHRPTPATSAMDFISFCDCIGPCGPSLPASEKALLAQVFDRSHAISRAARAEVREKGIRVSPECSHWLDEQREGTK